MLVITISNKDSGVGLRHHPNKYWFSLATLHARIKKMVVAGYLALDIQKDAHIKKVIPTSKAYKYFEQLSSSLVAAVTGS